MNREKIARIIATGFCEVTGQAFKIGAYPALYSNPLAPSLDRIDNDKGYTTRNVLVTTWAWNRFRSDLPITEAVRLFKQAARNAAVPTTAA